MGFEQFLSASGNYFTVTEVHPSVLGFETVGHKLVITGSAKSPVIGCLSGGHSYVFSNVFYDADSDEIRGYIIAFPHSIGFKVKLVDAEKKVIQFSVEPFQTVSGRNVGEPGSWTAEDPGPGN